MRWNNKIGLHPPPFPFIQPKKNVGRDLAGVHDSPRARCTTTYPGNVICLFLDFFFIEDVHMAIDNGRCMIYSAVVVFLVCIFLYVDSSCK